MAHLLLFMSQLSVISLERSSVPSQVSCLSPYFAYGAHPIWNGLIYGYFASVVSASVTRAQAPLKKQ